MLTLGAGGESLSSTSLYFPSAAPSRYILPFLLAVPGPLWCPPACCHLSPVLSCGSSEAAGRRRLRQVSSRSAVVSVRAPQQAGPCKNLAELLLYLVSPDAPGTPMAWFSALTDWVVQEASDRIICSESRL